MNLVNGLVAGAMAGAAAGLLNAGLTWAIVIGSMVAVALISAFGVALGPDRTARPRTHQHSLSEERLGGPPCSTTSST